MKKGKTILLLTFAIFAILFYRSCESVNEFKKLETSYYTQELQKKRQKEQAAYDSLRRETSGNFLYMRNSIFNHRDKSNNISAYIKYNYSSQKPYLFMKISCCTWATQTYAIFLKADNDFIDIDYVNDVYPLEIQTGNGKMYGILDIQIGEMLTDFLWKIYYYFYLYG